MIPGAAMGTSSFRENFRTLVFGGGGKATQHRRQGKRQGKAIPHQHQKTNGDRKLRKGRQNRTNIRKLMVTENCEIRVVFLAKWSVDRAAA